MPPVLAGATSISSHAFWPTSAIQSWSPPLASESKAKRHGLRRPYAQISPRRPAWPANGLDDGMV